MRLLNYFCLASTAHERTMRCEEALRTDLNKIHVTTPNWQGSAAIVPCAHLVTKLRALRLWNPPVVVGIHDSRNATTVLATVDMIIVAQASLPLIFEALTSPSPELKFTLAAEHMVPGPFVKNKVTWTPSAIVGNHAKQTLPVRPFIGELSAGDLRRQIRPSTQAPHSRDSRPHVCSEAHVPATTLRNSSSHDECCSQRNAAHTRARTAAEPHPQASCHYNQDSPPNGDSCPSMMNGKYAGESQGSPAKDGADPDLPKPKRQRDSLAQDTDNIATARGFR